MSKVVRIRSTLDSWKEIAVYLMREVRTVQRWEKNEGLPIHRHCHHEGCTVYAVKEEIDTWLRSRERKLAPGGPTHDVGRIHSNVIPVTTEYLAAFRSLVEAILADASCQSVSVTKRRAGKSVLRRAKRSKHILFEPPAQLERVLRMPNEKPNQASAPDVDGQGTL